MLFANCGLVPGGIDFIPEAMIDDGMLDVVVMSPRSAIGWLAMYAKILFKHKRQPAHHDDVPGRQDSHQVPGAHAARRSTATPPGLATKLTVRVAPRSLLIRVKGSDTA